MTHIKNLIRSIALHSQWAKFHPGNQTDWPTKNMTQCSSRRPRPRPIRSGRESKTRLIICFRSFPSSMRKNLAPNLFQMTPVKNWSANKVLNLIWILGKSVKPPNLGAGKKLKIIEQKNFTKLRRCSTTKSRGHTMYTGQRLRFLSNGKATRTPPGRASPSLPRTLLNWSRDTLYLSTKKFKIWNKTTLPPSPKLL